MEYIPGNIPESFQISRYYLLRYDFVWSNCTKRYSEFIDISDWDKYTYQIELYEGDIIQVKFFKYHVISTIHCYLEKVISTNGDEKIYNTESTISLNFLEHNMGDGKLFHSADKMINRNKIINSLIC